MPSSSFGTHSVSESEPEDDVGEGEGEGGRGGGGGGGGGGRGGVVKGSVGGQGAKSKNGGTCTCI